MPPPIPILLFAKAPVPGSVKTRLIPALGAERAARLAETLAVATLEAALASSVGPVSLWGAPDLAHPFFSTMLKRYAITLAVQEGPDLGARMEEALSRTLRHHAGAILTGTDLLHPTPGLYQEAARALQSGALATLAPNPDGGYVLIGLRHMIPSLFRGMAWGNPGVYAETLGRLKAYTESVVVLAPERDVDTPGDYEDWLRSGPPAPAARDFAKSPGST